jgi:8-oxo-dGTP pyrophosphatase MutT (NUDIX family)
MKYSAGLKQRVILVDFPYSRSDSSFMKVAELDRKPADLCQVAALPLRLDEYGIEHVLLLTSRETKRWVIPKGWPMKGRKPCEAAAREALEEAGLIGQPSKKPIGTFSYFKRRAAHFDICRVDVYLLKVEKQLKNWREKDQREIRWCSLNEAAELVQEPGLSALFRRLDRGGLSTQSPNL